MRPRTQKQPQVKKELCRVLDDVDVSVSLLSLGWNTAKSSSKLIVKFGSSLLVSAITFSVKTFPAETQTRLTLAAMLNSTRHVIYAPRCVYREIHHNNLIGIR